MKTHGTLRWHARPGGSTYYLTAAPYVMVRAKRLFPRASQTRAGAISLTDTAESSRDLEWLLSRYPVEMTAQTRERLTARAEEHRRREATVDRVLAGEPVALDSPLVPAREPYDHQRIAADLAATTGSLLLADDVGLGKSMSALLVLRAPDALPAVIVCLTHLQYQWMRELAATFPDLHGHVVRRMEPYDPAAYRSSGQRPDVLVIPYSKLRGWGDYLRGEARTVIFDEAQELRITGSLKYRAAEMVADGASYRLGLTATPVYNYGGEIHSVVSVLAPDALGSREEFLREWCGGDGYEGGGAFGGGRKARVADPGGLGLYLREQGVMLRRTRSEVGRDLPPLVAVPHVVDSDRDLLDRLSGDVVQLADLILARDTGRTERFRASGELDWRLRRATGLAKAPYVADFVRLLLESEERVVLYGWHRDVYEQWRRRLADLRPTFYTGTESPRQKEASFQEFTRGESRVLIVSLRAGAGLDGLQDACKVCVFGELDWSPGIHLQCVGRLRRDLSSGGEPEPVVAYFLVSEDGSDPVVAEVLDVKRMQSEPMLDPYLEAIEAAPRTEDRIRALARSVVERRRR